MRSVRLSVLVTLAALLYAAVVPTSLPASAQLPVPRYEPAECEFDPPYWWEVDCGNLIVLEDRANPRSPTISLHVATFRGENPDKALDPVVYLEGGPGGEALASAEYAFDYTFGPFAEYRDFIMFDQRGTGFSTPRLGCPEYSSLLYDILDENLSSADRINLIVGVMRSCRDRLVNSGANLAAYTSAASAADLEDLRIALGYPQWNLYGISYGTRLALTAMRDYPAGIRSVIIDSVYPPQANGIAEAATNADRAFKTLFAGCAADADCNAAYPDLETVFYSVVEQLNTTPAGVTLTHPLYGRRYDAVVDGDLLVSVVFRMLYSNWYIPQLPAVIYDARDGNYTLLANALASILYDDEGISIGMMYSVQCGEEAPFTNRDEYLTSLAPFPLMQGFLDSTANLGETFFQVCDVWGLGTPDLIENQPVYSDIPTLVMAGQYDPITPPNWARLTAAGLSRSFYYEYPGVGHGATVSDYCPLDMAIAFVNNPTVAPDAACIAEMPAPVFTIVDKSINLVEFSDDYQGIQGVYPEGWDDYGGMFFRPGSEDVMLLQQVYTGTTPDSLLTELRDSFELGSIPQSVGLRAANGFTWTLYESEYFSLAFDFALAERDGVVYLVMLQAPPGAERESLYASVFLPAIDAFRLL